MLVLGSVGEIQLCETPCAGLGFGGIARLRIAVICNSPHIVSGLTDKDKRISSVIRAKATECLSQNSANLHQTAFPRILFTRQNSSSSSSPSTLRGKIASQQALSSLKSAVKQQAGLTYLENADKFLAVTCSAAIENRISKLHLLVSYSPHHLSGLQECQVVG